MAALEVAVERERERERQTDLFIFRPAEATPLGSSGLSRGSFPGICSVYTEASRSGAYLSLSLELSLSLTHCCCCCCCCCRCQRLPVVESHVGLIVANGEQVCAGSP